MLNLLYKFGLKLQLADDLESVLIKPPKQKPDVKYYNVGILIDLDEKKVILDPKYLSEYDSQKSINEFYATRSILGNQKKFYLTVDGKGYEKLIGSLYNQNGKSDLKLRLEGHGDRFLETKIYKIVSKIEEDFDNFTYINNYDTVTEKGETIVFNKQIFLENIRKLIKLEAKADIMLYYLLIKDSGLGYNEPTVAAKIEGYIELVKAEFLPKASGTSGFCYVIGNDEDDILSGDFPANNLSKIFVTTTKNYASMFEEDNYPKNYSISKKAKEIITKASDFILENLRTNIAGIPHVLIPELPFNYQGNIEESVEKFNDVNNLIFDTQLFESFVEHFVAWNELEEQVYWFNYFGYLSDKNSFKILTRIRDVNSQNLLKIIKTFVENSKLIYPTTPKYIYNFKTIYNIIPVKTKESKKNYAFEIIDAILEGKQVDVQTLFFHFKELALYYYLDRGQIKTSYDNIYPKSDKKSDKKKFDFLINEAILKYLVLIKTLKDNNQLINHKFLEGYMEENKQSKKPNFEEEITKLFDMHGYNDMQKAMFYLGRMVSIIGSKQYEKRHEQKPILQKINFNGITLREITKLRSELYEKARQYNTDIAYFDSLFSKYFNYNDWKLSPNEALFFLLNGYSFGINISKANKSIEENNLNETEE